MRHAAVHFADQLLQEYEGSSFDAIFCSDFLNVAEFKGMATPAISRLPFVLYFHENQFAYPSRRYDERDLHFGFTNFTSCIAADQVWFNSAFNRDSFFEGLERACQQWPDFQPRRAIQSIKSRCRVESPGIDFPAITRSQHSRNGPLRIVWAARWEHDKNPALLLDCLHELTSRGIEFRISVIGQSFRRVPSEFTEIREQFSRQIDCWGFQETSREYWQALTDADVFISTADHEFFGISAAESIVSGVIPLLPDRLAYPELIRSSAHSTRKQLFLYDGSAKGLVEKLEYISNHIRSEKVQHARQELQSELTDQLAWTTRAPLMDKQIEGIPASFYPAR